MKKVIVISLMFLINAHNVFAANISCMNRVGHKAHDDYWTENKDKQTGTQEYRRLTSQKQREAKTRNICFGASLNWHTFCAWTKCVNSDEKIWGHTLAQYCEWSKLDCFTDDIEKIVSVLQDSGDTRYDMFFKDMNDITSSIANNTANTSMIDIDKTICYNTDDNGDTIWHAFMKNNKDPESWWNLCISYLKNDHLQDLVDATYKTKNKSGKTAVQEAIKTGGNSRAKYLLRTMSYYYTQEKFNCDDLARDISVSNDISFNEAKELIQQCY